MKYHKLAPLLGSLLLFTGCNSDLFKEAPGKYDGFFAEKANGQVQQTLATGRIVKDSATRLTVSLYNPKTFHPDCAVTPLDNCEPKAAPITVHVLEVNNKDSNRVSLDGVSLTKASGKDSNCWQDGDAKNPHPANRVCFDGRELSIDQLSGAVAVTTVIDKFDGELKPVLEPSKPFTLTELVNHSIDQSFNSQIQFQTVVQAKLNAQMAWTALLPHLSIGTFIGQLSTSPPPLIAWNTLVSNIGNLLPFLFPNRWFQAKEASLQEKSQEMAFVIAKADAGNITEGLAYAVARDTKALAMLQDSYKSIEQIRDQMIAREQNNLLEARSSAAVSAVLVGMESAITSLVQGLRQDYNSVSQAAGFQNPAAVESIDMTGQISIENPPNFEVGSIMDIAMQRAFEVKQLVYLEEEARQNKYERWFTWLDPSGSSAGGFGASIFPYLQVAPSQIVQIAKQIDRTKSLLELQGTNLFGQIGMYLAQYNIAKEGVAVQTLNIDRVMDDMMMGKTFTLSDLANGLQGQVNSKVNQINAEYAYYVAVSQVNRLLYAGPYARIAIGDPTPLVQAPPSSVVKSN